LKCQQDRRVMFGILLSCNEVEIIRIVRHKYPLIDTTGVLQLWDDGAYYLYCLLRENDLGFVKLRIPAPNRISFDYNMILERCEDLDVLQVGGEDHATVCKCVTYNQLQFILKCATTERIQMSLKREKDFLQVAAKWTEAKGVFPTLLVEGTYPMVPDFIESIFLSPCGTTLTHLDVHSNKIIDYMKNVDKALQMMHTNQYIHGDVTPDNIIIFEDKAILIDFGHTVKVGEPYRGCSIGFASIRTLFAFSNGKSYKPEPKDDFEGLFFTTLHLVTHGHTPWRNLDLESLKGIRTSSILIEFTNLVKNAKKFILGRYESTKGAKKIQI